ncbi:hypothetical protein ACFQO4_05695 [Saliphagus sp. GCM10025334]
MLLATTSGVAVSASPVGTTAVADSTSGDQVPNPIAAGTYEGQELEAGQSVTYDAELSEGEYFAAVALFESGTDLRVTIRDPSGTVVGETFSDREYEVAELLSVDEDGTYIVEIANEGTAAVTFILDVYHDGGSETDSEPSTDDVPDPLEEGTYGGQELEAGQSVTYEAELTENDFFSIMADFDSDADIAVTIRDPSGSAVGESFPHDDFYAADLTSTPTDGTYTVEIENRGETAATFILDVYYDEFESDPTRAQIPDPLEDGYFPGLELEKGETVTYDAELETGDLFTVSVLSGTDLEVMVTDPSGSAVGTDVRDGDYRTVNVVGAPTDGTYTVAVENRGETATETDLSVLYEPTPAVLENGSFEGTVDGMDFDISMINLNAGDDLSVTITSDDAADLEVTLFDSATEELATGEHGDGTVSLDLSDVESSDTHLLQVYNVGTSEVDYELEVSHSGHANATGKVGAEDEEARESGDEANESESNESESNESETTENTDGDGDESDAARQLDDETPGMTASGASLALLAVSSLLLGRTRVGDDA